MQDKQDAASGTSYERAVLRMQSDPDRQDFVKQCYLDDPLDAALRFAASDEFREVCRILSIAAGGKKLRVLDVGCGNGIASYAFASMGCDVVAMEPDPSPVVGTGAVNRLKDELKSGTIVSACCPVGNYKDDQGFDIVYARQVAHHFPVLEEGVSACAGLLRAGGTFLMTREHVADTPEDLESFRQKHALAQDGVWECAYPSARYREAMRSAGLSDIREWGPFDSVINYYPAPAEKIRGKAHDMMRARYGRIGGLLFRGLPAVERWAVHRLSELNRSPGRMYSFLGRKRG